MQCQSNPLILNSRRGLHAAPEGAVQNTPQIKMVWRQVDKKGSAGLNYVLLANDVPKCGWECLSLAYFVQGIHHLACPQYGSTTLSVRTTFPTVHGSCMEEHRWELTPPHNEDNRGRVHTANYRRQKACTNVIDEGLVSSTRDARGCQVFLAAVK